MAAVVGVHGIDQQYKGPNHLASIWAPHLRDGVRLAGGTLASDDFAMAFYGNMFRRQGSMASGFPPMNVADLNNDDIALLELWWRETARMDPAVPSPENKTMMYAPRSAQRALNALSQSTFFAGMSERLMVGSIKQVRLYFRDPKVRAKAIRSVENVVAEDTRVLIGHSLGSVVAYEALAKHPEWQVHTLVTLGSPLGIRNIVFDRLNPSPVGSRGLFPGRAKSWVNVASPGDPVALVKRLATWFDGPLTDHLVDNGAKAHDATRYLNTIEVGAAVRRGLG